jgi:ribonucleotide reductase alpha subunit
MLQVYNAIARYINQSGKRRGSFALYLEPHHPDIFEFLELRKNTGAESERARDLFLALWVSDLFMKQVQSDGDWYLMCPDKCPGLNDVYGDEYEKLYNKYIEEKKYNKKVKARELWSAIEVSQFETGAPYLSYKDNVNKKSNQKNIGIIRSSNLCVSGDTKILTDKGEIEINKLVNKKVNVWNGYEWSKVKIFLTAEKSNENMLKIKFSNGRFLKCTKYHKFYLENGKEVRANELKLNIKLLKYKLPFDSEYNNIYVNEIIEIPFEKTYCFTEPKRHMGIFNGILTGQCNEIVEYSDANETAACNLASISLPSYVVNKDLSESKFVIYSKKDCPYCKWSKNLLTNKKIEFEEIEVIPDSEEYHKLKEKLNDPLSKITFPRIFDNDKLVGGMEELYKYTACEYDYKKLWEVAYYLLDNLNSVIDRNYYPTIESRRSNMKHRPVGLGVQGLADVLAKLRVPYSSEEALEINDKIFGTIYHAALTASNDIARDRELDFKILLEFFKEHPKKKPTGEFYDKDFSCLPKKIEKIYHKLRPHSTELEKTKFLGSYSTFEGSPFSEGKLQYHLWEEKPVDIGKLVPEKSWEELIENIKKYGTRNSLLTALMPTASTSQLLGNYESFEPFTSNIYTRRTLAGEFIVVNKHLIKDLMELNEWSIDTKNLIIENNGSIQNLKLPKIIKDNYLTAYEMKQKWIIDGCIVRGKYIDQTQSMNLYFPEPDSKKLISSQMYAWKKGLKTGLYYLRSKPAVNARKTTISTKVVKVDEEDEGCLMCSA